MLLNGANAMTALNAYTATGVKTHAATRWGSDTLLKTVSSAETTAGWAVTQIQMSNDQKTVDFSSVWRKSSATTTDESYIKQGNKGTLYQGVSFSSDFGKTWSSKFASATPTETVVSGSVSAIASAGVALALLATTF